MMELKFLNDPDPEKAQQKKNILAFSLALIFMILVTMWMSYGSKESISSGGPDEDVKLKVIQYIDFRCRSSALAASSVRRLRVEYADDMDFEIRHFPLEFHRGSDIAAQASECARDQGHFWQFHDYLFNLTSEGVNVGTRNALDGVAKEMGLDMSRYEACMRFQKYGPLVLRHIELGRSQGVRGTPTFFIGDEAIIGYKSHEQISEMIEAKI